MRIAIIDDLANDSMLIANYIRQYFQETCRTEPVVIKQFEDGESFIQFFSEGAYELILIDYFMHTMTGLETARYIRQIDRSVFIVFTTASRDFAIDCYKVHASDYIVKPVTYAKLAQSMSLINLNTLQHTQYIRLSCGREQVKLFLKDIIYCDASGHYVQIHVQNHHLLRSRTSFEKFSQDLMVYPQFLLCYRGCLINMDHIIRIDNLDFLTSEGEHIPIRQKEYARLTRTYHDYIFKKVRSNG